MNQLAKRASLIAALKLFTATFLLCCAQTQTSGQSGGRPTPTPRPRSTPHTTPRPAPTPHAAARPPQMTNHAGIEFVWVPPGSFMMGSDRGDPNERPVHHVTIGKGFFMGRYEVTQAQWERVMGLGSNPSHFKGENLPADQVTWVAANAFISHLNAQGDGYTYRLPTEAEWEYAARAGTTSDYAGELDAMGWYVNNSGRLNITRDVLEPLREKASVDYVNLSMRNGGQTHPVGKKAPNAFGLFDMHGNVWEWCQDFYHDSYEGAPDDGSAWLSGGHTEYRLLRGGSWIDLDSWCRSATRAYSIPYFTFHIGFRVVAVKQGQ